MGEIIAHEQKRLAPGLRMSVCKTVAEVKIGLVTDDLAEAGGGLDRLACEIRRHSGLFSLERFAEPDDRRERSGDILGRDGALSPDAARASPSVDSKIVIGGTANGPP
jgi:hypothetical protein